MNFKKIGAGVQFLQNVRKYVKYIEATVKVVEYAIEQFGSIGGDARPDETIVSPQTETENV